jgi:DivIVA domain-containing protein
MSVDHTSLDRIRNATFPTARRGYDKREVEKFLAKLAEWLETGGGDETRSDAVKRELERVGQRTGAILAQAEESAQQIRADAEQEAQDTVRRAEEAAEETRGAADAYASESRTSADAYAEETRAKTDEEAEVAIDAAEAEARRIVEEGTARRRDIEAVISDLVRRRDAVLGDIEELTDELKAVVADHGPDSDTGRLEADTGRLEVPGEPDSPGGADAEVVDAEAEPEQGPESGSRVEA